MRIAVLSDIHSNLLALNLAVEDIKKRNIDKICFLGDYITDGDNAREVLSIVRNISDYTILGNRERYILDYTPAKKEFINYKSVSTTYESLTEKDLEYIASLKDHYTVTLNGFKILMIHSDKYYIDEESTEETFDEIIADYDFDICLFGHTHKHIFKEYKNRYFINPGSVGLPYDDPTYKYCIMELTDRITMTLRKFDVKESYDRLVADYKKSDYYKSNRMWTDMILYMIRDGIDYISLFIEQFDEKIKDLNELNAENFNKIWKEAYEDFRKKYDLD